ncbi:MAG: hypothetical protein Q8L72_09635 [Moraxellaceae bacterium]|nr:hypothetical protein [Moraxellaceae bacterium]
MVEDRREYIPVGYGAPSLARTFPNHCNPTPEGDQPQYEDER